MIYFDPSYCPKTREEAFKLQEQTVYLQYHLELVRQVIDVLQENYFNKDAKAVKEDALTFARSYKSIQMQIETAATLLDDCLEYIGLLRGEENCYTTATDRTIMARNKIRELYLQG